MARAPRGKKTKLPPAAMRLAKLTRPRGEGLVARERLHALLDAARDVPLIWLFAPPGSGKTSLVASYLGARGRPVAWVQVDAGDADPATFFHYLTLAAAGVTGTEPALPVFTPHDGANAAHFARRYFREWFATAMPDVVLVLDNIQEVSDAPHWHAMLVAMVEETPPGMQTLALSRSGLPPELSRARLARQVTILEWPQLRLQRDEAAALAASVGAMSDGGGQVSDAVTDHLFEQSQGWAAGLVLLLERLRQSGTLQPDAFAGSLESVFDYFATQVFNANPEAVQNTLMRLSFLPQVDAATAVAISGDASAGQLLERLAQRNLFIDRRLGDTPGYRFHALFRAFLQARARQRLGNVERLRCALLSGQILRQAGELEGAIRLYLDEGDWAAATDLVLEHAESLSRSGRHQTLSEWIEALPKALREADPWLTYWLGVAIVGRDPAASRVLIEHALVVFTETDKDAGQVRAIASLMSGWWAERASLRWLEPYVGRLNALLDGDRGLDLRTRAVGLISLARARLMIQPNDPLLADYASRLAALPIDKLSPELVVGLGTCLVCYHWGVGDSEACTAVIRRTRAAAERSDVPVSDRLWFWFYEMTHLVYLADTAGGREVMRKARELHDASGQSPPFADFVRWDVTLELQLGRPDRAREMLETELVPLLADASLSTQACIDLEQARCAIEEQRLGDAVAHAQRGVTLCGEGGLGWLRASLGLTLGCAQALAGQCDDADATLQTLRLHVGSNLSILSGSIETYQALVHLQSNRLDAARDALDAAVQLRRVTTYPWGPGWNRPGIARVAGFALQEGRHVLEMQRIAKKLRLDPPSPDIDLWPWAVQVKVLDNFSVQLDDGTQRATAGKSSHRLLDLLKTLAAMGGDAVPVETLADAVWPDADGDLARRSLDTGLSRLRKLLQCEDAVTIHDGKVSLRSQRVSLDLRAFEYLRQQLRAEPRGGERWLRVAQQALAIYRRPLLDGERDAPWLAGARATIRRQWLEIVRSVVERHEAHADHAAAQRVRNEASLIDEAAPST